MSAPEWWQVKEKVWADKLNAMWQHILNVEARAASLEAQLQMALGEREQFPEFDAVLTSESSGAYNFSQIQRDSAGTAWEVAPWGLTTASTGATCTPYRPMKTNGSIKGLPVGSLGTGAIVSVRIIPSSIGEAKYICYPHGFSGDFPILATWDSGGSAGDDSTATSWTYTVTDITGNFTFASSVNPTSSPHKYARPDVGPLTKATDGTARFVSNGDFSIISINETLDGGACS